MSQRLWYDKASGSYYLVDPKSGHAEQISDAHAEAIGHHQAEVEAQERLRAMQYEHAGMDTEYTDHTPDRYYDEEDA